MNRADVWLGNTAPNGQPGNVEVRAMDTARLIAQRPSIIIVIRRNPDTGVDDFLPPQTVRIEVIQSIRSAGEQRNSQLEVPKQYVVVIGLRNHPTLPNLNVLRADRFFYQERVYEIIEMIDTVPGRLLASAELTP